MSDYYGYATNAENVIREGNNQAPNIRVEQQANIIAIAQVEATLAVAAALHDVAVALMEREVE